ncbi:MAG: hypothetical protein K2M45_08215 [Muribaculaceae bacterium]|nr:hypothetical protein [Muribaculaceae bacterium]
MPDSSALSSLISLLEAERARDSISPARLAAIYRALQTYSDECDAEIIKSISDKEKAIKELISAEASARETADSAEASARTSAVAAEAKARVNADNNLSSLIQQEASNRTSAISSETSERQAADATLQQSINNEASDRKNADNNLSSLIYQEAASRLSAVSSEASARQDADAALQQSINNEAKDRELGDELLQSHIDEESLNRVKADNSIKASINQIKLDYVERHPNPDEDLIYVMSAEGWRPIVPNYGLELTGGGQLLRISSDGFKMALIKAINVMPEVNIDWVATQLGIAPPKIDAYNPAKSIIEFIKSAVIQGVAITPCVGQIFKMQQKTMLLKYSDWEHYEAWSTVAEYLTAPPSDDALYGYKNGKWVRIADPGQKILGISEAAIAQSVEVVSIVDQSEAVSAIGSAENVPDQREALPAAGFDEKDIPDQSEALSAPGSAENVVPDQSEALSAGSAENVVPDQREAVPAPGFAENKHNNTEDHE